MKEKLTVRGQILDKARMLTEGDRNQSYGDPKDGMGCFAQMIDAYIDSRCVSWGPDDGINATDAAIIMVLLKVSRVAVDQGHADSYFDMAAYSAIAGECAGVSV